MCSSRSGGRAVRAARATPCSCRCTGTSPTAKNRRHFNLAGPLLWARRASETTRGLLPLFWYSRDVQSNRAARPCCRCSTSAIHAQSQTFATALFGFGKAPDSLWWYTGNFVWRDNWKTRFCTFFPLWFSVSRQGHRDHNTGDPAAAALRAFQSRALALGPGSCSSGIAATSPRPPPWACRFTTICTRTMRAG